MALSAVASKQVTASRTEMAQIAFSNVTLVLGGKPIVEDLSPDGIRSPDPGFQRAVEDRLAQEIAERRLTVLRLDPAGRPAWLDTVERAVWERVRPAQIPLPSPSPLQ